MSEAAASRLRIDEVNGDHRPHHRFDRDEATHFGRQENEPDVVAACLVQPLPAPGAEFTNV